MHSETRDRINREIGLARQYRAEAQAIIDDASRGPNDPEVAEKIDASNAAYDAADRWKAMGALEDADEAAERWQRELASEPSPSTLELSRVDEKYDPTMAPEYRAMFETYVRRGHRHGLSETERRALTEGEDQDGGYFVPADTLARVAQRLPASAPVFALTNSFPTSRDRVTYPRVKRHATNGSIYTSAFVGSWTGEIPSASAGQNEPGFGQIVIDINKYRAMARVSVDLADDSEFPILSFLEVDGARNGGLARDYAILRGSGVGTEPLGILSRDHVTSAPAEDQLLAVDIEGSVSNTISNSTSAVGSAPKLFDLYYSLPAQYRALPSARMVMNSQTEKKIRKLVDANGQFLWMPGFAGRPNEFMGAALAISEWMPDDGSDGNLPILWGALEFIVTPVRRQLTVQVATERYVDTDEIGFFLRQRMGVGVENFDAFRLGEV